MNWYYVSNGSEVGPVSAAKLRELAEAGDLGPDDMVRSDEMNQLVKAGRIKGLFPPTASRTLGKGDGDQIVQVASPTPASSFGSARGVAHSIGNATKLKALELHELPKADMATGTKAYQFGLLSETLQSQYDEIRRIEEDVAQKRRTSPAEEHATLMDRTKSLASSAKALVDIERLLHDRKRILVEVGRRIRQVSLPDGIAEVVAEVRIARQIVDQIEVLQQAASSQHRVKLPTRKTALTLAASGIVVVSIGWMIFSSFTANSDFSVVVSTPDGPVTLRQGNQNAETVHERVAREQQERQLNQLEESERTKTSIAQKKSRQAREKERREEVRKNAEVERTRRHEAAVEAKRKNELDIAQAKAKKEAKVKTRRLAVLKSCLASPEDYVIVYRKKKNQKNPIQDLVDINSLKTVLSGVNFQTSSRPILGITDRLFGDDPEPSHRKPFGIDNRSVEMFDPLDDKMRVRSPSGHNGIYLSLDLQRVVYHDESGDIWRADFNWSIGQLENKKKITNRGLFSKCRPMLFSGNSYYLSNPTNEKNPIVHIDLTDGTVTERESLTEVEGEPLYSPNARFAIVTSSRWIHVRDMHRNEFVNIDNLSSDRHPMNSELGYPLVERPEFTWIDEYTAITRAINGRVAVLDLRKAEIRLLNLGQGPPRHFENPDELFSTTLKGLLPNTRLLHVTCRNRKSLVYEHYLVDVDTGQMEELPSFLENVSWWLNSSNCVYAVKSGGLEEVGFWMFDRTNGQSTKLSPHTSIKTWLNVPGKELFFYRSDNGSYSQLETSGKQIKTIDEWKGDVIRIGRIIPVAIDLGMDTQARDPWLLEEPAKIFPARSEIEMPKFLSGKKSLQEILENESDEIQQFGQLAYQECLSSSLPSLYDPQKAAVEMVRMFKQYVASAEEADIARNRISKWDSLINRMMHALDLKRCLDPKRVRVYIYKVAMMHDTHSLSAWNKLSIEDQNKKSKIYSAVAKKFTKNFIKNPFRISSKSFRKFKTSIGFAVRAASK